MRVIEYKDERFSALEGKKDVAEFREMLIKAYYVLDTGLRPPRRP